MSNIIYLPVSLGEALDKLSILSLKLEKIKDTRIEDVKKEYNILFNYLKDYINIYTFLYDELKKINLEIWNYMDLLRDGNLNDDEYFFFNKKTIIQNDVRFRIKNKINLISNSEIKEQKAYNITKKTINLTNDYYVETEFFNENKPTSLLYQIIDDSLNYDEITILCNSSNIKFIKKYFSYDKTIIIY
jgi:hypothetical protein